METSKTTRSPKKLAGGITNEFKESSDFLSTAGGPKPTEFVTPDPGEFPAIDNTVNQDGDSEDGDSEDSSYYDESEYDSENRPPVWKFGQPRAPVSVPVKGSPAYNKNSNKNSEVPAPAPEPAPSNEKKSAGAKRNNSVSANKK